MNLHPQKKHAANYDAVVQAVLPNVRVIVTATGALDVTVDGAVFSPPPRGQWTRGGFAELLDAVTKDRTVAVRIEVREVDGSVFTDLIHPRKRTRIRDPEPPAIAEQPLRRRKTPALVELTADGYLPGEDVAVAVIVTHVDASCGTARALLDLSQIPPSLGGVRDVLLFGRISGAIHVRPLP